MPSKKPSVTTYLEDSLKAHLDKYKASTGARSLSEAVSKALQEFFEGGQSSVSVQQQLKDLEGRVSALEERRQYSTGTDRVLYFPGGDGPKGAVKSAIPAPQPDGPEKYYTRDDALKMAGYQMSPRHFRQTMGIHPDDWLYGQRWNRRGRYWYPLPPDE